MTLVAQAVPADNGLIEAIKKTMPTYGQQLSSPLLWRQVVDNNLIRDVDLGALPGLIKVQPLPDQNSLVMTVDNADPMQDATAVRYDSITYQQVLERQLKVMDASAISLCMDNNLPIVVFNMRQAGNITRVVSGEPGVGTRVWLGK